MEKYYIGIKNGNLNYNIYLLKFSKKINLF